jgi:predicted methyltransferase
MVRKPDQVLAFAGVKPADKVADFVPRQGYYTRLLSKLVGAKGKVYAVVPGGLVLPRGRGPRIAQRSGKPPSYVPSDLAEACVRGCYPDGAPPYMLDVDFLLAIQNVTEYSNVTVMWEGLEDMGGQFAVPEQLDAVISSEGYHQLHAKDAKLNVPNIDKALLHSLKPGGVFVVVDYASAKGAGEAAADLHRSDADAVKAELTGVGFTFDGESKILAQAGDDHSKAVDEQAPGNADRFVMKFRKPMSMTGDKRPPASWMAGYFGNTEVSNPGSTGNVTLVRSRAVMYHPDGSYQEWGKVGFGPAPMQMGQWFWDADGHNCMLHQYPLDERGNINCHEMPGPVKVGDTWKQGKVSHVLMPGYHPLY